MSSVVFHQRFLGCCFFFSFCINILWYSKENSPAGRRLALPIWFWVLILTGLQMRCFSSCLETLWRVFVFTEATWASLSPGTAQLSFFLCNTLLILHAQVLYKEDVSPGTAIGKTPEMLRVKQTQDHISSVRTRPSHLSYSQPDFDKSVTSESHSKAVTGNSIRPKSRCPDIAASTCCVLVEVLRRMRVDVESRGLGENGTYQHQRMDLSGDTCVATYVLIKWTAGCEDAGGQEASSCFCIL